MSPSLSSSLCLSFSVSHSQSWRVLSHPLWFVPRWFQRPGAWCPSTTPGFTKADARIAFGQSAPDLHPWYFHTHTLGWSGGWPYLLNGDFRLQYSLNSLMSEGKWCDSIQISLPSFAEAQFYNIIWPPVCLRSACTDGQEGEDGQTRTEDWAGRQGERMKRKERGRKL